MYKARHDGSFCVRNEEYTGPGEMRSMLLLVMCCLRQRIDHVSLLIDAGADPDSNAGTGCSPMCTASGQGNVAIMKL